MLHWPSLVSCSCCRSRFQQHYEVLGELGRGAFGAALKARRHRDGALVCLKVLLSQSMGATERRLVRAANAQRLASF